MRSASATVSDGGLFQPIAKLLGLFLVYQMIVYAGSALLFAVGSPQPTPLAIQLAIAGVAALFAFFLIFRTDRLASLVGFGAAAPPRRAESPDRGFLRDGIVLLGLYLIIRSLESVLRTLSFYASGMAGPGFDLRLFVDLLPIALAMFFILRPGRVIDLTGARHTPTDPDDTQLLVDPSEPSNR